MKNKITFIIGLFILVLGTLMVIFFGSIHSAPNDKKGIYVTESKSKRWADYSPAEKEAKHAKAIKAIDESNESSRLGDLYVRRGDYTNAVLAYEKAYSIVPDADFGMELARTYEKLGRYDDAIALLDQMIEKKQLSDVGNQTAREMIDHFQAEKEGKQSLSYLTVKALQYEKLGDTYYQAGDLSSAIDSYKEAYRKNEGTAKATLGFKLVRTFEKIGRPDKAISLLNDMIEKNQLSEIDLQTAQEMIYRLRAAN